MRKLMVAVLLLLCLGMPKMTLAGKWSQSWQCRREWRYEAVSVTHVPHSIYGRGTYHVNYGFREYRSCPVQSNTINLRDTWQQPSVQPQVLLQPGY